jgi:glucose/arabinose dehydrogenase
MKRFAVLCVLMIGSAGACARSLPLNTIKLPPGFQISVFADNVPNARQMALSPGGVLFVGSREAGKVHAIVDHNRDGKADKVYTIASGLTMPSGVAFRGGSLYVAEVSRVLRFDDIEAKLAKPPRPVIVNDRFPSDRHHGWKFIAFGPDGLLYVPVGAPCNICEPDFHRYANIMRMQADGSALEVFAKGIRNSVGFDWHPETRELWFTSNGGDDLGDNVPPDELNRSPKKGMHFGYPYCHGGFIPDPKFGNKHKCSEFIAPEVKLGPHVAALGMRFYRGGMFPAEYKNRIFIAEHGSWNRSDKVGYRVTTVVPGSGRYEVFAEGWLQGEQAWGRPADVLTLPDGSLLVADDRAGAIYRITYKAR